MGEGGLNGENCFKKLLKNWNNTKGAQCLTYQNLKFYGNKIYYTKIWYFVIVILKWFSVIRVIALVALVSNFVLRPLVCKAGIDIPSLSVDVTTSGSIEQGCILCMLASKWQIIGIIVQSLLYLLRVIDVWVDNYIMSFIKVWYANQLYFYAWLYLNI